MREAGLTEQLTVRVDLDQAPPSNEPIDVVFLFDVTGSMTDVIGVVRRRALEILTSIDRLTTNTAFAVGSFTDYGSPGEPWRLDQDITEDSDTARRSLENVALRASHNEDIPEAYSRALYESLGLSWRAGARRYVILFGDAPPKDPTFFGVATGVDAGRDGVPGTADDLRFAQVMEQLRSAEITVLAIVDETKRGTLWSPPSPFVNETVRAFEYMAAQTGGLMTPVSGADEIPAAVEGALRETFRPRPALQVPPEWAPWVRMSGAHPTEGESVFDFDVVLQPPSETEYGVYRFPLIATQGGDIGGGEIGFTGVTLRLGWWNYPWRPILVLLYLVALPLTFLAWAAGQGNIARRIPYYGHWAIVRLTGRMLALSLVVVGFYLVWTETPGTLPPFSR